MPKIKVFDTSAKEVGVIELSDEIFAVPYNESLIHEVVVAQLANSRQGTQSALFRGEVRGHARKPYKQKGTGNARHGSTKSPEFRGGGVVFAPKPRDYSKKVNKKAKVLAFLSAMSTKIAENEVIVIKEWDIVAPKTKLMQNVMENFNLIGRNVIVVDEPNDVVLRASNNIPKLSVVPSELLSVYDIVSNKNLIMTEATIKNLEEAFK